MTEISPRAFGVFEARLRRVQLLLEGDRPDRHEEATRDAIAALTDAGAFDGEPVPEIERGRGLIELGWTLVVFYFADADSLSAFLVPNDMIPPAWRSALARVSGKTFVAEDVDLLDPDELVAWMLVGEASGTLTVGLLPGYHEVAAADVARLRLEWQRFECELITEALWPRGPLTAVCWYTEASPTIRISQESGDAEEP